MVRPPPSTRLIWLSIPACATPGTANNAAMAVATATRTRPISFMVSLACVGDGPLGPRRQRRRLRWITTTEFQCPEKDIGTATVGQREPLRRVGALPPTAGGRSSPTWSTTAVYAGPATRREPSGAVRGGPPAGSAGTSKMVWRNVIAQPAVTVIRLRAPVAIALIGGFLRQIAAEDRVNCSLVRPTGTAHHDMTM